MYKNIEKIKRENYMYLTVQTCSSLSNSKKMLKDFAFKTSERAKFPNLFW